MTYDKGISRRMFLGTTAAGAAATLIGGTRANGVVDLGTSSYTPRIITPQEALIPGRKMYQGRVVPFNLGIVDISLTRSLNRNNADRILGYAAACLGAEDNDHKQPRIQILIAHNPKTLNLAGSEADYVKQFDYLLPLLEKHNLGVDGLFFNGEGNEAHMISYNHYDRDRAELYGKASVNIIRRLNGGLVSGPGFFCEHTRFADVHFEKAVDHIKRIADYAARYGITICGEPLRSEETDGVNTLEEITNIINLVGSTNFKILFDTCHIYQGNGPDLAESAKKALITGVGDTHASRWMPWRHPKNRSRFEEGDKEDPVCQQLENIMMVFAVNGYNGSFYFEGPHIVFKNALGQGDPYKIGDAPEDIQDGVALSNAWVSVAIMKRARNNVEKRLAKRN